MAEEKIKSLDEDINALLLSPIYNMSMCTLENFHTEFWKWLGNTYPHEFLKAIVDKDYSEIPPEKIHFKSQADAGKANILDLLIKVDENGEDEEYIIIENKIKSYPNNEQLERYADYFKGKTAKFILTSLVPKPEDLQGEWQYKSYGDISNGLKREFIDSNFEYKDDYHKLLITDYINVIRIMDAKFPKEDTKKYDFYETNELDVIGLKDIYMKYRTSELEKYIRSCISKEDYVVSSDFHNKKGTIDIGNLGKGFPKDFEVRIQIEGNQYRYCLLGLCNNDKDANNIRKNICLKLKEESLWFNDTDDPQKPKIYKDSFCGYKYGFIYRYFRLDDYFKPKSEDNFKLKDIFYESIAKKVKEDLDNLEKNIERINEIITDELKRNESIIK